MRSAKLELVSWPQTRFWATFLGCNGTLMLPWFRAWHTGKAIESSRGVRWAIVTHSRNDTAPKGLQRCALDGNIRLMKIELTARHERYIEDKVKSGAYSSPDEVVREGLRLLEAGDERTRRLAWLQAEVERGFTGPTTPWTAKDTHRVRQLVVRRSRRSR